MTRASRLFVYGLGTWFGCGWVPLAPGLAGTLGALPLYFALRSLGAGALLTVSLALAGLGALVAGKIAHERHEEDPQIVVVDEVAGVLVTLAAAPMSASAVVVSVLAFRVFDQWKPWPANAAERLPHGWGVVLDDLVAGMYGAAAVHLLHRAGVL